MWKLTINTPARRVEISPYNEPNRFAHFEGSYEQMRKIARLFNEAFSQMDNIDRHVPIDDAEIQKILDEYDEGEL